MKHVRKYQVMRSGSGWGIWCAATGEKIMSCFNRFDALDKWYDLEGWKKPTRWY